MPQTQSVVPLLWIAGGCLAAFVVVGFLWGFLRPFLDEFRVLRGDGPLRLEQAHMAYGASLFVWRVCVVLACVSVALWYSFEVVGGRIAAAISLVLLGLGWWSRSLGVRRMRRSLEAGGYGPRHLP